MSRVELGENCEIEPNVNLGLAIERIGSPTIIGDGAHLRTGTVVYAGTTAGKQLRTGHGALIRELTMLGDEVLVGTSATIDGECDIGSNVSLQTGAYIPTNTTIGDEVFIGPGAVLTNDPVPIRDDDESRIVGPTIESGATVGANATVLPDVTVGADSFVAAGAVVTRDIPPNRLAVGVPAEASELPPKLAGGNVIQ